MAAANGEKTVVDDRELVGASKEGDLTAFAELYRRHVGGVIALARSRLRDRTLASDVAQEAFATALARLGQLRHEERFGGWVRTIAANLCVDVNRAPAALELVIDLTDVNDAPDRTMERRETVAGVRSALAELSPSDRELLVLRDLEDWPLAEVAAVRGLTYGAAEVAMARARRRLRLACERAQLAAIAVVGAAWRRLVARRGPEADTWVPLVAAALPAVLLAVALTLDSPHPRPDPQMMPPVPGAVPVRPLAQRSLTALHEQLGTAAGVDRRGTYGAPAAAREQANPSGAPLEVLDTVTVSRRRPDQPESLAARGTVTMADETVSTGVSGGYEDLRPPPQSCASGRVDASPSVSVGATDAEVEVRHRPCSP